jgi:hypothetical protein
LQVSFEHFIHIISNPKTLTHFITSGKKIEKSTSSSSQGPFLDKLLLIILKMNNDSGFSTLKFQSGRVLVTLSVTGLSESHILFTLRDLIQKITIDNDVKPPVEEKLNNSPKITKCTVKEASKTKPDDTWASIMMQDESSSCVEIVSMSNVDKKVKKREVK